MIALLYSDTELTSLTYAETPSVGEQELFRTTNNPRATVTTTGDEGTTLAGRNYSHILYAHKSYSSITISPDELVAGGYLTLANRKATGKSGTLLDFLEAFWLAPFKYICNPVATGGTYVRVVTDAGEFPLEYIDGIKYFPQVTLSLKKVSKE